MTSQTHSKRFAGIAGAGVKLALKAGLVAVATAPLLVAGARPSSAANGAGFAYVVADRPTATAGYQPAHRFNSAGGQNSVLRTGTGAYVVGLSNLVARGVVHVTAVGSSASCKPVSWGYVFVGQRVEVRCFNPAGAATDSRFALTFTSSREAGNTGAYLVAGSPSAPSYVPGVQFNSTAATNTVARTGAGRYTASLPGLGARAGTVQVTAIGAGSERCKAVGWGPSGTYQTVQLLCTTAAGTPVDAMFTLTYARDTSTLLDSDVEGAYVWADLPAAVTYTPNTRYQGPFATTPATVTKNTAVNGDYTVHLPGNADFANALVTSVGSDAAYCNVQSWNDVNGSVVRVRCFTPTGLPANSSFTLANIRNTPVE